MAERDITIPKVEMSGCPHCIRAAILHVTYHQGICSIGMKKPLVNPAKLAMMGEIRNATLG